MRNVGFETPLPFRTLEDGRFFFSSTIRHWTWWSSTNINFFHISRLKRYGNVKQPGQRWDFQVQPSIFSQIFILHIFLYQSTLSRVFALLPNKGEETYLRLFTQLNNMQCNFLTETIITEFEKSLTPTIVTVNFWVFFTQPDFICIVCA